MKHQNCNKHINDTARHYVHGFAPSATSSMRRDDRFTSLWSFCANSAQCMSRDFTTATVADSCTIQQFKIISINVMVNRKSTQLHYINKHTKYLHRQLKINILKQTLPLNRVTIFSHDAGSVFMMAYGTKMTCMPLNRLYKSPLQTILL